MSLSLPPPPEVGSEGFKGWLYRLWKLVMGGLATNNLTGVITSVGPATSIASQTGSGSTFVMQSGPTINGTVTLGGQVTKGGAPEKVQRDSTPIPLANPIVSLKSGTVASPSTTATYETPMIYVERYTANTSTTASSDWNSNRLQPAILAEVIAMDGDAQAPAGLAVRSFTDTTAGGAYDVDRFILGIAAVAQSNATAGTANRDIFACNFVATFSSGNKPKNCVGIEVDVIPSTHANATLARSGTDPDNFTAYWAQNGSATAVAYSGLYVTSLNDTIGWQYGVLIDAAIHSRLAYLKTVIDDAGAKGIYVETTYDTDDTGSVLEAAINGSTVFKIDSGGHVNVVGTGKRFLADFSNGTRANRFLFKDSTTNNNTNVGAIPNGTGTSSVFTAFGGSDADNTHAIQIATAAAASVVNSTKFGTGTQRALEFQIAGVTKAQITTTGSVVLGASAALATNATDGFTYLPTCAGTPTGVPTSVTGMAPAVIDTTNSKLCAYIGGAWKSVTLT